jgi:hypothetical protein
VAPAEPVDELLLLDEPPHPAATAATASGTMSHFNFGIDPPVRVSVPFGRDCGGARLSRGKQPGGNVVNLW